MSQLSILNNELVGLIELINGKRE